MLYTDRIKNLEPAHSRLTRVWIRTENPNLPLKAVWINESRLQPSFDQTSGEADSSIIDISDEHLALAA